MASIGQNSILGNFSSSFEHAYARAGFSFSFAFGKGVKWGVGKGDNFSFLYRGVWGETFFSFYRGKEGGKTGEPFSFSF